MKERVRATEIGDQNPANPRRQRRPFLLMFQRSVHFSICSGPLAIEQRRNYLGRVHCEENAGPQRATIQTRKSISCRNQFFWRVTFPPHAGERGRIEASAEGAHRRREASDLQSDALKNDARLQTAFDNSPLMTSGEKSEGVKTLQRCLRDLGYDMTVSFAKTGDADGIFGSETYKAVYKFQVDHSLVYRDGIVGRETLLTLDELLLGQQTPCNIKYAPGPLGYQERTAFLEKNFSPSDRPGARKILDDLCQVAQATLAFESEQELRDEIFKRLKISQYMQESQTSGAFGYPETATDCPGKNRKRSGRRPGQQSGEGLLEGADP